MDCRALASHKLPRQSKLFLEYLNNFSKVQAFYAHPPKMSSVTAVARDLNFPQERRTAVVASLRAQNAALGASPAVSGNLDRLEKGAVAVVSGQQVGLFSGPAYSFYKALSAIQLAYELTRSGTEAVPVFWMATEDHDVDEVRHVSWFQDGLLRRFELPSPGEQDAGRPVGKLLLGPQIDEHVHDAAELLAKQGSVLLAQFLNESYNRSETYGSAFGKLFARLFSQQGLILLDPLDPALHRVAAPIYRQAIEHRDVLNEKLLKRGKELEAAGFSAQVKVTAKSTLLFYMGNQYGDKAQPDGVRKPIATAGNGKFQAGEMQWNTAELSKAIESAPEDFSPSALLRAVVQDYLLPTVAYIGGAAEIAYFAQSEVVYRHVLERMPVILPRPDFTLVDVKAAKLLDAYKLKVEDIWAGSQEVRRRMELASVPKDLSRDFDRNHKQLMKMLDQLHGQLKKLDPTLQGAVETARKKIEYQIDKLRRKTGRAQDGKATLLAVYEDFLEQMLYPHKVLQSRELCLLPFLARWGPGGLTELQKLCGSRNLGRHCIVQLS
ncbi:MAG TPA: bacillithiol biosynthesis cysteine-adding enzyme BshC [Candidatus Acidoferrum sp.]|jgi:bacillithiol biosynthesis cysteine-adding enzyme BshC|nr:bacillithiol biosynthesis cysteine-adding enzyme BshC [Candidatus Acidoferrum sp.]